MYQKTLNKLCYPHVLYLQSQGGKTQKKKSLCKKSQPLHQNTRRSQPTCKNGTKTWQFQIGFEDVNETGYHLQVYPSRQLQRERETERERERQRERQRHTDTENTKRQKKKREKRWEKFQKKKETEEGRRLRSIIPDEGVDRRTFQRVGELLASP
jgi:hypothetical protein